MGGRGMERGGRERERGRERVKEDGMEGDMRSKCPWASAGVKEDDVQGYCC
jgi:hypothetical protein